MRRWRVFGVDDQKAVQLHEALERYLTTRDADNFGIEATDGVPLTAGNVSSALRHIADAVAPFDCIVIDVDLSRHREDGPALPQKLNRYNQPYGTWIGRYVIEAGLPTELLYYSEAHGDLLGGFDLPSMGVRFVPGADWERVCERVLEVLEQRQAAFLNRSVEGRAALSEFLSLIDRLDPDEPNAVRRFLARTFTLHESQDETATWRIGDFFLRTSLAIAGSRRTAAAAFKRLRETLGDLQARGGTIYSSGTDVEECGGMIARSQSMKEVFSVIRRIATTDVSVLIHGETGTGKELVARAIHERSHRSGGTARFVPVNCSAIPHDLIESELFGHEKGAFTGATERKIGRFEQADKGTIFLDEVGDMSLPAQAKVLRALQEREVDRLGSSHTIKVDIRVIAATNKDLRREVREGRFREDLYHRLCVIPITIPPLRERREDIGPIAARVLRKLAKKHKAPEARAAAPVDLSADDIARLEGMAWRGNVRELENVLEAAYVLLSDGQTSPEASLGVVLSQRLDESEPVRSSADAGAIWARIKSKEEPPQTLGDLELEFGRNTAVEVGKLALEEYQMSDAAALFHMTYRNFEQWLRRRGYIKGQPRGRYSAT